MKIFVSVATHEQPFDRLMKLVEDVASQYPNDEFVVQYGYSRKPTAPNIKGYKFLSYDEMQVQYKQADCVISHAGPASIFDALEQNINPIIVPRYEGLGEHVNNHQVEFTKFLVSKGFPIIPVFSNDTLLKPISKILNNPKGNIEYKPHTHEFNVSLQNTITRLMRKNQ